MRKSTPALNGLLAPGRSAAAHSRKSKLALAPLTGEIERQLEQLIKRFGYGEVRDALTPLISHCAFKDWECVANAVDRLARKRKRTRSSTPKKPL